MREVTPKTQEGKPASRAIKPRNLGPRLWVSSKAPLLPDAILRGRGQALPREKAILIGSSDPDLTIILDKSTFSSLNCFLLLTSFQKSFKNSAKNSDTLHLNSPNANTLLHLLHSYACVSGFPKSHVYFF